MGARRRAGARAEPDAVEKAQSSVTGWASRSTRATSPRPCARTRRTSADGRRPTSASTSGACPSRRPSCSCSRTCTGPTKPRSALINAADAVLHDCPVLVVATTRPTLLERHPHWGEGLDFHSRLTLRSLSRRETRRLLEEILKRADRVPQALGDLVVMASEGNPFYVEELVNWFVEAEVITKDADSWHVLDERLEQAKVPATLRSVLQARLDALSIAERLALQRASVIGRVFWDDAVESLGSDGDPVAAPGDVPTGEALDRLRGREVVYQREKSAFDHNREFLFKHALLRDVAYEGMLRRHRRTYHRFAARWFEQMAERIATRRRVRRPDRRPPCPGGDGEAAARWYLIAGKQAAVGPRARRRQATARAGARPRARRRHAAALRPADGPRVVARPHRRPGRPAGRPGRSSTPSNRSSPGSTRSAASACC